MHACRAMHMDQVWACKPPCVARGLSVAEYELQLAELSYSAQHFCFEWWTPLLRSMMNLDTPNQDSTGPTPKVTFYFLSKKLFSFEQTMLSCLTVLPHRKAEVRAGWGWGKGPRSLYTRMFVVCRRPGMETGMLSLDHMRGIW